MRSNYARFFCAVSYPKPLGAWIFVEKNMAIGFGNRERGYTTGQIDALERMMQSINNGVKTMNWAGLKRATFPLIYGAMFVLLGIVSTLNRD